MHEARPHRLLKISTAASGYGQTLATAESITVPESGLVSVVCSVDNGTEDQAPTDNPNGALKMYACGAVTDTAEFVPVTKADADLLVISPKGDNVNVKGIASFECTPGVAIKIVYVRSSGGGSGSRIRVRVIA